MQILSMQEQSILSRYLYDNLTPCNLGILICLYTGLRIGEICALKWKDICIAEHYLDVHKTMQRVQIMDDKKKTTVLIQRPKSDCSIRKIPLPDTILSILQSEKKETDAFILTGSAQKFIEPRCMENRFKTVLKACGVNNYKFHTLRHTFATRCVELGFDIKSLSEILCHASVSITLNRYVHPSMELKQKNMNLLIDLFPSD
jgi:integrase